MPLLSYAASDSCLKYLAVFSKPHISTQPLSSRQAQQLELMLLGLKNTSRSMGFNPFGFFEFGQKAKVKANFKESAIYILTQSQSLNLDLKTAVELNQMLTKGIVDPKFLGDVNSRPYSKTRLKAQPFHLHPQAFYKWLETPEASELFKADPIRLAELAHHTISALDSFPDANGRLARIFSDLILIKAGLSPAYYPAMKQYFGWNAASEATRDQQLRAYKDSVHSGQYYMGPP
jgi:hypothetical protein